MRRSGLTALARAPAGPCAAGRERRRRWHAACLRRRMFFAPFPLLFTWLSGLISLAVLGGGVYLLWAWYVGVVVGTGYLVAGLVMTVFSLVGRWFVLLF